MHLILVRTTFDNNSTIGTLTTPDLSLFTLEEPRGTGQGISGECILAGTYQVILTYSPKFEREMPLLVGVPNRTAIRIHYGNTAKDTAGCLLVGETASTDFIGNSRAAFEALDSKIDAAISNGETVQITIS